MLKRNIICWSILSLCLVGCETTKDLSHLSPYKDFIGQCGGLKQTAYVFRGAGGHCGIAGDYLLNYSLRNKCFGREVAEIPAGTTFEIVSVNRRTQYFGAGTCPLVLARVNDESQTLPIVSLSACPFALEEDSWAENVPWWTEGSPIIFKEGIWEECE